MFVNVQRFDYNIKRQSIFLSRIDGSGMGGRFWLFRWRGFRCFLFRGFACLCVRFNGYGSRLRYGFCLFFLAIAVIVKGDFHVLTVYFRHSPCFNIALLRNIVKPILRKLAEFATQFGRILTRFRVDILENAQVVLLECQRLQCPGLPVNAESHFRVVHQIAHLLIGVADGDSILRNPLDMQGHHAFSGLHL